MLIFVEVACDDLNIRFRDVEDMDVDVFKKFE